MFEHAPSNLAIVLDMEACRPGVYLTRQHYKQEGLFSYRIAKARTTRRLSLGFPGTRLVLKEGECWPAQQPSSCRLVQQGPRRVRV